MLEGHFELTYKFIHKLLTEVNNLQIDFLCQFIDWLLHSIRKADKVYQKDLSPILFNSKSLPLCHSTVFSSQQINIYLMKFIAIRNLSHE